MKTLYYNDVLAMIDDDELREKFVAKKEAGFLNGEVYNGPGDKDDVIKRVTAYLEG